jgi:hypothetical protein
MLVKKETTGDITIYYVEKDFDDSKMKQKLDKKIKRDNITIILDHDADVFTNDGKLLIRFRKIN